MEIYTKMVVEIKNQRFWKIVLLKMRTDRVDQLILYIRPFLPNIPFRNAAYDYLYIYIDIAQQHYLLPG